VSARTVRLVVDNTNGADAGFAAELVGAFEQAGFEVALWEPTPGAIFDTAVRFGLGIGVRVMGDADQQALDAVATVIRETELRQSLRRRFRAVPIYRGEGLRPLAWVDIFG
jgi:hypothetical protein